MTFDPTKPVKTIEGHEARIICTNKIGNHPIVALIKGYTRKDEEEIEFVETYESNGKYLDTDKDYCMDLVNIKEEEKWHYEWIFKRR